MSSVTPTDGPSSPNSAGAVDSEAVEGASSSTATKTEEVGGAGAAAGAEAINATENVGATEAGTAVSSADSVDAVCGSSALSPLGAKVVDGISSGSLSVTEARDTLIEGIVERQLGPEAPPELANAVRDEIRTLLEGDPTLAELLG